MTNSELHDPTLSAIIARKLAKVHTLDVPINKDPTWLFDTINKWLDLVRSHDVTHVNPDKQELAKFLLDFNFENELKWLKSLIVQLKSPVVFSHNDLQEGNILLPDMTQNKMESFFSQSNQAIDESVVLIDFEYSSYNYRGFDLGNHFCEWVYDYSNPEFPHFFANQTNYPSVSQQRLFIREYLKHSATGNIFMKSDGQKIKQENKKGNNRKLSDLEDVLLVEANAFVLASHMLWTLWSINNAFTSKIQFGYWVCKSCLI